MDSGVLDSTRSVNLFRQKTQRFPLEPCVAQHGALGIERCGTIERDHFRPIVVQVKDDLIGAGELAVPDNRSLLGPSKV